MTIEITRMAQCAIVVITESESLSVSNWKLGMQTPYDSLPTVISLKDDGTNDETYDNLVKAVSKRTNSQVVVSLNIPVQLFSENNLIISKLISDEILAL